jgi:hypothetical protein
MKTDLETKKLDNMQQLGNPVHDYEKVISAKCLYRRMLCATAQLRFSFFLRNSPGTCSESAYWKRNRFFQSLICPRELERRALAARLASWPSGHKGDRAQTRKVQCLSPRRRPQLALQAALSIRAALQAEREGKTGSIAAASCAGWINTSCIRKLRQHKINGYQ